MKHIKLLSKKVIFVIGGTISLLIGLNYGYEGSREVQADNLYTPPYCTSITDIDLIVVDVNSPSNQSGHQLAAYNRNGSLVTRGNVVLGRDTFRSIGRPSVFANSNPTCQATPLGVYTTGKIWRTKQGDTEARQMGFDWSKQVSDSERLGRLFIELSGRPVDGGAALGGLSTSDRHIGIHSSSDKKLKVTTYGCAKTSGTILDVLARNLINTGSVKVIVTDQVLAGVINVPSPATKQVSATVTITGPKGKVEVHTYQGTPNWWIAEVARPVGKYTVTISAPGFKTETTEVTYIRDGNNKLIEKNGATDVTLSY